ncbi:MAG: hypothetical protein R2737_09130 [Candidatus Nanopelagicales bacterium]
MTGPAARQGERRLPMALAVAVAAGLYLVLPPDFRLTEAAVWAYPAFLLGLLVVLILGDPGRIDRERRWLRVTTGVMVAAITVAAAVSAVRLVVGILTDADFTDAAELLTIGAVVWVTMVIAYALWYWQLDSGGPAARANGTLRGLPAFRFPEHSLDDPAYAEWYPQFVDYLALSFSTGTAFGPTDVSAVRHWSKLWLISESALSLAIIGLVVARAINEL